MDKRYMIKLIRTRRDWVEMRVKCSTSDRRWSDEYLLPYEKLWEFFCKSDTNLVLSDGYNYVEFTKRNERVMITTTRVNLYPDGRITGRQDTFMLPMADIGGFLCCAESGEAGAWLDMKPVRGPKIVVKDTKNLHEIASNPIYRRKFAKFMRDAFQWYGATEIELYNDFVPYSFFFREKCGERDGMCGGVILHGQDDPHKAYYGIHT